MPVCIACSRKCSIDPLGLAFFFHHRPGSLVNDSSDDVEF